MNTAFKYLIFLGIFSYGISCSLALNSASIDKVSANTQPKLLVKGNILIIENIQKFKSKNKKIKTFISLKKEFYEAPFFEVKPIDLEQDGKWEVEVTGVCGNKVCEKIIYKYNNKTNNYSEYFRGAYSSIFVFDGYLIESGASGCCSYEHHAYVINYDGSFFAKNPNIIIQINRTTDVNNETSTCVFINDKSTVISPPSSKWAKLCEISGLGAMSFKTDTPPTPAQATSTVTL